MSLQYTVSNHRVPGAPVILRTMSRDVALGWRHYRITCRDRGRDYYGLRALERRAAAIVQYAIPGTGPDQYINREG